MASLSGLQSGFFTDIDVVDTISINGNAGTANQVLTSDGTNTSYQDPTPPAVSSLITAGTGINITATGNPETISTNVKSLVLDGTAVSGAPQTFNPNANGGSQTITINDTDTQLTLVGQNGIVITDLGGTNRGIATDIDADTIVFNGTEMEVAKVPNSITFATDGTGSSTGTFDGSSAITIDNRNTDTQLNLIDGNGITITNTGGLNRTIDVNADGTTLSNNVGSGQAGVIKVPNALTAGTNITFSSGTTYDGSAAITISSTDTNTTYTAGTNLNLSGTTFNLNASLTSIDSITFTSTASATSLTGNNYPAAGYQTPMTYFNLLDSTNIVSPYFLHDVYDPSTADTDSLSTSYVTIFSNNLKNSFTAQSTSCCIELLTYNYSISGNRWLYLQLGDNTGTEWSSGATADGGGTGTGTRITARTIQYTDETDKVPVRQTWYLQGLTVGTSYTINPMAKTSSTLNYIYAGGDYPACILRGYYLPTTSS
jgi:hypothetical protein